MQRASWKCVAVSPGGGGWGASWACRLPLVERVSSAALPSSLEGSITDLVAPLSHSCCPQGQDIPQWQDLTVLAGPRAGLKTVMPVRSQLLASWARGVSHEKGSTQVCCCFPKCLNKKARLFAQKHFHKKMVLPRLSYSGVSVSASR